MTTAIERRMMDLIQVSNEAQERIHVQTLHDKNATVTRVTLHGRSFTGSSKRNKGEVHDSVVGHHISTARALRKLALALEAEALARLPEEEEQRG